MVPLLRRDTYDEPILEPRQDEWDSARVGSPYVMSMAKGKWRLYYGGSDKPSGAYRAVGLALSQEGPAFEDMPVRFGRRRGSQ